MQTTPHTLPVPDRALRRLDPELLRCTVAGLGLRGETLAAELGDEPAVWIFLRHFG